MGWGYTCCALCGWGCPRVAYLAGSLGTTFRMKLFKVFFVFLLLAGDYRLKPASLGVFPQQKCGCDGRANLLFAPIEPFLLRPSPCGGGVTLLVVAAVIALRKLKLIIFGPTVICFKHWLVSKGPLLVIHFQNFRSSTCMVFKGVAATVCW